MIIKKYGPVILSLTSLLVLSLPGCATMERYSSFPDARIRRGERQPNQLLPRLTADDSGSEQANRQPGDTRVQQTRAAGSGISRMVEDGYGREFSVSTAGLSENRRRLVQAALSLLGRENLRFSDATFPLDCTGVVLAAYHEADLDLTAEFTKYTGNGVQRLYEMAYSNGTAFSSRLPAPGDVIIWDNTYDRNENTRWDDEYTHTGIVVDVNQDGQITYIHHNYAKGIVAARMNLQKAQTYLAETQESGSTLINSPMRMKSHRYLNPDMWLSSHLFRTYVSLAELPRD
ncbi:CHAP domain-containing protein [Spirochaeta lutea]|uniref:CHAP domain-containing protein n=1 Tax=Spirochaeta lutea TaxID=1480694 RepID=UPI00068F2B89|nr:CHAP domain-containing protein [Spirochaeta lutea]